MLRCCTISFVRLERPQIARSFLIDAGAHHCGYAADVTRTWAAPEESDFDDLIDAVDRVQIQAVR